MGISTKNYFVDGVEIRDCSKCGNPFPATTQYFHKQGRNYLRPECKICSASTSAKYYKANAKAIKKQNRDEYAKDPKGNAAHTRAVRLATAIRQWRKG